jgi:membrane-associated phospholipid phosphatase
VTEQHSVRGLSLLKAITDLGDLAVLLPISAAILIWLLCFPSRLAAVQWVLAAGVCIGGTAALKVLFVVCPPAETLQSPSGHTSLSTLIYGALTVFATAKAKSGWRPATAVAGALLVGAIAASRVVLNAHTLMETVLGLAIGVGVLAVFARSYLRARGPEAPLQPLLLGVAVLVVALHGSQLRAEELLKAIGMELQADGIACR